MAILVGDVGGTKTNLAIVSDATGPRELLHERTFSSPKYPGLEAMISEYLHRLSILIDHACLAVAGPIKHGWSTITNLSWVVNADQLRHSFQWSSVSLINDLEAMAYAIPILEPDDVHTLEEGTPVVGGNIAVIAPGTGLGEAFLTVHGGEYHAHASEGPHVSFAPANQLQTELLTYMRDRKGFKHVSYERVCSEAFGCSNL